MGKTTIVRAVAVAFALALAPAACGNSRAAGGDSADGGADTIPVLTGDGSADGADDGGIIGGGGLPDAHVDFGHYTPTFTNGPICSSAGWCWENPLPQGNTLSAAWGSGDNDLWVGGTHGTLIHWDGQGWSNQHAVDPDVAIGALWGTATNDVWAAGTRGSGTSTTSAILHFNGLAWSPVDHPGASSFSDLDGSGPDNVWAVGISGPMRWDGAGWRQVNCPNCLTQGIWTNGPSDTWVVGPRNLIGHWDGAAWTPPAGSWDGAWAAVWGSGPNDVWIVGDGGAMAHWDGHEVKHATSGVFDDLMSIWGSGPNDVWAAGQSGTLLHYDGTGWSAAAIAPGGPDLRRVIGRDASQVWAVGQAGRTLHWNGARWTPMSNGVTSQFNTITGSGPTDIWLGSAGGIQHWDQRLQLSPLAGAPTGIAAIFSRGPNRVWVVGDSAAFWDGSAWHDMPGSGALTSVWAADENDVWAGGANELGLQQLRHWDGQAWSGVADPLPQGSVSRIAGNAADDVWAVTQMGEAFHFDGTTWTPVATGVVSVLQGLMTFDSGQAWAVGAGGTVLHLTPAGSTLEPTPFGTSLESIVHAGANDHWLVGYGGVIGHFDGTRWTASDSGTDLWLMDIWASSAEDVWAVGFDGAVLHKH